MATLFLGIKNIGTKHGARNVSGDVATRAAMAWVFDSNAGPGVTYIQPTGVTAIVAPGEPNAYSGTSANQFVQMIIDPAAQQSSFTFGDALAMEVKIRRLKSYASSSTVYTQTGRVIIYLPSSGQIFTFGSTPVISSVDLTALPTPFYEWSNNVVPIFLSQVSSIQVFIESDNLSGAAVSGLSTVVLTLFNFSVPPVGVTS